MYPTLDAYNMTQGFHVLICYVNDATIGYFMKMMIFTILVLLTLAAYFAQKRTSGVGDFQSSFMAGTFITLLICIVWRLLDCPFAPMIDTVTISVMIALTFVAFMLLVFNQDD